MDLVPWGRGKLWPEPSLSILQNLINIRRLNTEDGYVENYVGRD
jgi:hypothetical protein